MNFQNIEYFLTVAKYGNFTKAAKSLYISQQSLSENIRRLEEEIGTPLFVRGKTLTLTPAGECFLSGGSKLLSVQDKMLREIAIISNTTRCTIVLESLSMDLPPFLPQAMKECSEKYPEYELTVHPESTAEIPDFSFSIEEPDKTIEAIPLIEGDPFGVVINHTLGEQTFGADWPSVKTQLKKEQELNLLQSLPFLILYKNKSPYPSLELLFQEAGFLPREAFKSEDANLLCSLCTTGAGAFIGPEDYCRRKFGPLLDPVTGTMAFYTLKSDLTTTLSLTYPKGKHLNQAEKRFIEVLRSVIANG